MNHIPEPRTSLAKGAIALLARLPWAPMLGLLVAFVALVVFSDDAFARSGGSGGGMRFRGGGGGGGGGGFGGGGGGFHVYGCLYVPFEFIVIAIVVMIIMSIVANARKKAAEAVRIHRMRFAIEMPGDRPWEELERLVRQSNLHAHDGLANLCRETALYLRRRAPRITHAAMAADGKRLDRDSGEARFVELTSSARGYFDREVLRIEAGKVIEKVREGSVSADGLHDEDGDFGINEFFLVTIILGIRANAAPLPLTIATAQDVDTVLARLGGVTAEEVVACEVVWTPAAESDILTSDNLLESFPELGRLV